ncbi:GGDEF domain-containing protein [Variovorax sp. HJSM1_2]|uniref:GGDEF domain-containing protein n=1 Tax=Variovorax sp. HJSM1_2 TaxID=3366263 RepID=UPI003BD99E57
MSELSPNEIARETLKQLATKKLAPTPENYQTLYHEIAGTLPPAFFPSEPLRKIAAVLPAKNPGQQKQLGLLTSAIGQRSWDGVQNALIGFAGFGMAPAPQADAAVVGRANPALTAEFMEQVARLIENVQPALGLDDERFNMATKEVLGALRHQSLDALKAKVAVANYTHRVSFAAEEQMEIRDGLLKLLNLVFDNIAELSSEDQWLTGQIDALKAVAVAPLNLRRLDEVQVLLKDVIFKQTEAKGSANEAQEQMRQLLATFVERLSLITESSSNFHTTIEACARQIESAQNMEELGPVLKNVIQATREMAHETMMSHNDLQSLRNKAQEAEAEIVKLHIELDRASAQARHDTLTGALNRRGLDEAIQREISTGRRKGTIMCIAMLDVDNFKKLNDDMGHEAGDAALTHLAGVIRGCLRPQDSLARYGGEEFVILLPDTVLDAAVAVLARLQRELTTQFFLRDNQKVLITFSAGVAELAAEESSADGLRRADHAMYVAKRSGKNRVLGG